MTFRRLHPILLSAVLFIAPASVEAQIGPLIDWIHKMSGPQFWGIETSVTLGYRPGQFLPRGTESIVQTAAAGDVRDQAIGGCLSPFIRWGGSNETAWLGRAYDERSIDQLRLWIKDGNDSISADLVTAFSCEIGEIMSRALQRIDPMSGYFARLGAFAGLDQEPFGDETLDLWVVGLQPTVGHAWSIFPGDAPGPTVELETGFMLQYFFGEIDPFWHLSFPVLVSTRPLARHANRLVRAIRFGSGVRIFPPFQPDAFAPLFANDADLRSTQVKWVLFVGFDFTMS